MRDTSPPETLPVLIYDCFSDTRFGGNVGGVVLEADGLPTGTMQQIAREINAPVTGFVTAQNGTEVTARFFMPTAEIAMCGHVTVGLFSYLSQQAGSGHADYVLKAQAGEVAVEVVDAVDGPPAVFMEMGLPDIRTLETETTDLAQALGLKSGELGNVNPVEIAQAGLNHLFVQLETLADVRGLAPDFKRLKDVSDTLGVHTIACFAMQADEEDNTLHIRDFCPAVGVDEVPASGTTNGALAGYLVRHGLVAQGDRTIRAEQGMELGRPSVILMEVSSQNGKLTRLRVGGQAVASLTGSIARG